ncbi:MAG: hypothetical protein OEM38_00790 [Gammaproteobacteria bacterium]|nr:hypothetical protein [Gammaproteobacteria bacterium]
MKAEIAIYLLIAMGSLLMISFIPHMLLDGLVSNDLKENITVGVTIFWAIGLAALGLDIVKKRKGLKD